MVCSCQFEEQSNIKALKLADRKKILFAKYIRVKNTIKINIRRC